MGIEAVLVTGGAGYIGSATVNELAQDPSIKKIAVLDDLSFGHRAAVHKRAELFEGRLNDPTAIARAISHLIEDDGRLDPEQIAVIHFAAFTSVPESVAQPLKYWQNNVANAVNLIAEMREAGLRRLVFSSTAATYGVPQVPELKEDHPQKPINPYGDSKLTVEKILRSMAEAKTSPDSGMQVDPGLRAIALRYFNAYGAVHVDENHGEMSMIGEDHNPETHMVPNAFKANMRQDPSKPFSLFGNDYPTTDGTCVRDYIHIKDLASAHILAVKHLAGGAPKEGFFDAFNVGTGRGTSNMEIIREVEKLTGLATHIQVKERRAGDPPTLIADATKLRETLGWSPQYADYREGLKTVYEWMTRYPKGYDDRSK